MDGGSWKLIGEPSRPDGLGPQDKMQMMIRDAATRRKNGMSRSGNMVHCALRGGIS
jgi:hypothetical protein